MNREHIELWLEREFDTVSLPTEMADKIQPLLARVYSEGYEDGRVDQADGVAPENHFDDAEGNPYGKPTDYARSR